MFRSLWFHKLLGLKSRSARRRQAAQTRRGVRLQLEGLEDRITPSGGMTVPTDANQLLTAISAANATPNQAVTINLQAGGTYNLTDIGSDLTILSKAGITINGNGATINAASGNRVFEVHSGDKLVLENVTVTGGNLNSTTAQGGGIKDSGGFVTLSGANVTGNSVHGGSFAQGGGVFVSGAGTLTVKNGSHIDNNKAIGSSAGGGRTSASGGGIYVTGGGAVSITNSTVDSNLARGGNNSGSRTHGAFGGGLFMEGGSVVNITSSHIDKNTARGGNGTGTTRFGDGSDGGVAKGGGVYISGDGWKVSITGTTLNGNNAFGGQGAKGGQTTIGDANGATGGDGGTAKGGGAYVSDSGAGFSVLSSSFNGNTAQGGAGGQGGHGTDGGSGGTGGSGGGAKGGGLWFSSEGGSGLKILGTSFDSNHANGGAGGLGGVGGVGVKTGGSGGTGGDGGEAEGGGVFLSAHGGVNIANSSVTNNNATGGQGGTGGVGGFGSTSGGNGGFGGNGATGEGGGITWDTGGADPQVINTTIGANTAQGGNAGVGGAGGKTQSDATHGANGGVGSAGGAQGGGFDNSDENRHVDFINDTVAFNVARTGTGGLNSGENNNLTPTAPEAQGGGIDGSNVELINTMLTGNIATDGPDIDGAVGLGSNHNFVSNTDGIDNLPVLEFGVGNILNNQTRQLGPLQQFGTGAGATFFYPLLANSAGINAGSTSVQADIANAQGVPIDAITDQIGAPRINPTNGLIDIGSVSFFAGTTTVTVPDVNVTQSATFTPVILTADIASQTGELINEGQVTFTVKDLGGNTVGSPVTAFSVTNGVATAMFNVPGNQPVGTYHIDASYTDPVNGASGGRFGPGNGEGNLTVSTTPASTTTTVGDVKLDFSTSPQNPNVLVAVNSPAGTVSGNVTVTLFDKTNNPVASGSAAVTGGSASVPITVPASFAAGTYQLKAVFTDGTDFSGSTGFGSLTINSPSSSSQSPMPVTVVNTPLTTTGTVTNTVTTTTNNDLPSAIALFFDVVAFVLDQNGFSSISASFNLPTTTTDAFNLAVQKFNEVGGTLGATVIPMAAQTGQDLVNSLKGH